jgi:hypothetical protein
MYTTPADAGRYQFAWPEWVDHGYSNWTTGESNTLGMAVYSQYQAPTYCATLVAHSKDDWYLPAPNEMSVLTSNRTAIGGFQPNDDEPGYWTAAEGGDNKAWFQRVWGTNLFTSKGIRHWVRCVRKD